MIEHEISQSPAPLLRNKQRRDNSPTTLSKRPCLHLDRTPTVAHVGHLQLLLLPNPTYAHKLAQPQDNDMMNAKSFSLSSPCTDMQQEDMLEHHSSSSLPGSSVCKSWPVDFYAIDITNYLQEIQSPTNKKNLANKKKVQVTFEQHFAVPFKSSTFYDHEDCCQGASLDMKETFLSRVDGHWSLGTFYGSQSCTQCCFESGAQMGHKKEQQVGEMSSHGRSVSDMEV